MAQDFLCGVVEGFYGRPWTHAQRLELFRNLRSWGMNAYMYGPKDDIKLRARWRELYTSQEAARLRELVSACQCEGIDFIYAIAPGLDIAYAAPQDSDALTGKIEQLLALGVKHVTILFDDIPHRMREADEAHFGTFARAQCYVSNHLFTRVRQRQPQARVFFCPTDYCARMANPSVQDSVYLREVGELLHPDIEVFWTGDEIVSETISSPSIHELQRVLKRKPIIWDNLHANDYDIRRLYLGPYSGRDTQLREVVTGILTNPNCEYELNTIPLRTLAHYAQEPNYQPREAFLQGLEAWLEAFGIEGGDPITKAELALLCDIFYLPFELGPSAQKFLQTTRQLLAGNLDETQLQEVVLYSDTIQALFEKLTELKDRDLLYALYNYVWEIRTETQLLANYLRWLASDPPKGASFARPEVIANTYRGGMAAEIQKLLPLDATGSVAPSKDRVQAPF
jgi:hypothetical protein